jgi:hypothetical protein
MGHRGMDERPEVADLSDTKLLERVADAREQVRRAKERADMIITDAMVRGLNQSLIAKTAGVTRRALFDISSREWERRQSDSAHDEP